MYWTKEKARVEVVTDPKVIRELIVNPDLYPYLMDDSAPPAKEWEPDMSYIWIGCYYTNVLLGLVVIHQLTAAMWQVHTIFKPKYWGTGLPRLVAPMTKPLAFKLSKAQKFYAMIPVQNTQVIDFAKDVWDMEIEGICKDGWLMNGKTMNTYHLGVSK